MKKDISQMSMLEVAIMLMEQKRTPQHIKKLLDETLQMKGINDEDGSYAAQLYVDITTSSMFVYMGDDEWDLKSRQSLDKWDLDGSAFASDEEDEEIIDDNKDDYISDYDDFNDEDDHEDNIEFDKVVENPDEDDYDYDDYGDDDNDIDFDEDDYEGYMDDYENLYDK